MSQQEDILFCNIGIQGGMISEEDAKRCLVYSSKVEASGKARPRIGTVFVKAKILSQQNAQRIYHALEKRGVASGDPGPAPATRRSRKGDPRHKGRRANHRPRAKVDSRTLTIGIVSLVALVSAALAMGFMVIKQRAPDESRTTDPIQTQPGNDNTVSPSEAKNSMLGGDSAKTATPAIPANEEARETFSPEHLVALQDARVLRGENYAKALGRLTSFREQKAQYYEMFPDLLKELETDVADIDSVMREDVDATLQQAERLVGEGYPDEAARVLDGLRDRVTDELKTPIDQRKKEILQ